jgi:hypothetical protein
MGAAVRPLTVVAIAIVMALSALQPFAVRAAGQTPDVTLGQILHRLASSPAAPSQYTAAVQLHVRLRFFPWISLTLHGDEIYKHPGFYHFVFRGVPKVAERFSDMAYDLGNPTAWPDKYAISLIVTPAPGINPVVRLVPEKRGMVKSLDVTVDADKGAIEKAIWQRYDGGTITMTQKYDVVASRQVVAEQEAAIRIPNMSADVTATYSNFALDSGGTH